ncbi:hypothetical protein ACIBQ1_27305 [Nonomuraea sp. NPDC050153]|uniref:hypothetical protein n=1 Tax=Nonomuraea sp. NPDC050153 TaxID=3364359 RepID=UPI0037BB6B87
MSDTDRETQVVYGTRLASADRLSEAADGLERALHASLARARNAGSTGDPDDLSEQFDAEFAELPGLARDAYAATARLLRERADKVGLSERNYAKAEHADVESARHLSTAMEEL